MGLRVLLVDDHRLVRQGLRGLLEALPQVDAVDEAGNGRQAVDLAREVQPDVVLMDVAMPDLDGVEATRRILAEAPVTRVIALSMHNDRRFVSGMLQAGASGYLLKDCAFEELADALREVVSGRPYLSPGIETAAATAPGPLSPREREVLALLADGKGTRETADLLCVSVKTVETHRQHIMQKLGLSSVADLTKYAIREGLTTLGS